MFFSCEFYFTRRERWNDTQKIQIKHGCILHFIVSKQKAGKAIISNKIPFFNIIIQREQIVLSKITPDFLIYIFSYGNFKIRSPLENLLVKNNPQSILMQDHLPLLLLYVAVDQAEVILVLVIESQTLPYHLKLLKKFFSIQ